MSNAYKQHYEKLVGAVITRYLGEEESDYSVHPFPMLRAKLLDGTWVILTISSDAEGNEGGHIFIEPDEEFTETVSAIRQGKKQYEEKA